MSDEINWEQQAKQFQAELDRVNPLLDVAEARVGELTARLQLAEAERDQARQQAETQLAQLGQLKTHLDTQEAAHSATLAETQDQRAKADAERGRLRNENARLSQLCQRQREGLAQALKVAGDFVAAIHAALGAE